MKKLFILFVMMFAFTNIINAQSFEREGNTFVAKSNKGSKAKSEPTKTKFTWKDSKGNEYPVYMSSTGSCFVWTFLFPLFLSVDIYNKLNSK